MATTPAAVTADEKVAAVDVEIDVSVEKYEAIIETATATNQTLYDQVAALDAQIKTLIEQRNSLRAQIAASEGADVRKAREVKQALSDIKEGRGGGPGRRFR